jgi:RNA polymerase sigma-70 factor, ECF subfamily
MNASQPQIPANHEPVDFMDPTSLEMGRASGRVPHGSRCPLRLSRKVPAAISSIRLDVAMAHSDGPNDGPKGGVLAARVPPVPPDSLVRARPGPVQGDEFGRMQPSDEELVRRFQGGDASAFEAMVARWNEPILQLATRLIGDLEEAKDLTQMALLKTYQGLDRFEGRARFSTWIYRVVLNLCRDRARSVAVRERAQEQTTREHDGDYVLEETGFHVARDRELAALVARAVLALPSSEREVVVLRHYHDLPFPAIAEILGSPVTTVKSRMARGLTELRARLATLET